MSEASLPLLVVIAGPTAVGKTAISIALAKYFDTAVLSADSRQCYKEMNIGTARPSLEEQDGVAHYFVASHSIKEPLTAVDYETYALRALEEVFQKKNIAIVCGGTGLYIQALLEGFDEMPAIDKGIEAAVIKSYEEKGLEWLQSQIQEKESSYVEEGLPLDNPHRMLRALIFKLSTGQSIIEFRKGSKKERPFNTILIGLDRPRTELYDRVNLRVDQMMMQGLLEEANELYPNRSLKNLDTVGYRELFEYLDGSISLQDAVEKIKRNSRRYAKRQITWFKRMENIQWFEPEELEAIIQHIESSEFYTNLK